MGLQVFTLPSQRIQGKCIKHVKVLIILPSSFVYMNSSSTVQTLGSGTTTDISINNFIDIAEGVNG